MENSPCSIQAMNSPGIVIDDWICPIPDVYIREQNERRRVGRGVTELPLYRITEVRSEGRSASEETLQSITQLTGRRIP